MLPKFLADLDPNAYWSDNYVVLDFEIDTGHGDYGNPVHSNNVMLLGVWKLGKGHPCVGPMSFRVWGDEYNEDWKYLRDDIAKADFVVAHNAKYELGWLIRLGVDPRKVFVFDTRLAEYTLLGNLAAGAKDLGMAPMLTSLDMCCRRRGLPIKDPVVDVMIGHGINPVGIPQSWLEGRCRQDVETTEQVFLSQRKQLAERGLLPVQYTRCLLTPVLAAIETEGLKLDADLVRSTHEEYKYKLGRLEQEMQETFGSVPKGNKQMAALLYDQLGFRELTDRRGRPKRNAPTKRNTEGSRKTDDKTQKQLVAKTVKQKKFLELRKELSKTRAAIDKNLEFFRGVVEDYDGVFYAELHQTKTATGRLSSTGIETQFKSILDKKGKPATRSVQIQNTPRQFKKLFIAKRPGYLIGEPDGSQLEFRVAAFLGNDERARADIEDVNYDVHRFTASVLFDVAYEAVETEGANSQRQLAKPETFKPLYGGSKGTDAQEAYYAAFRARYPGIAAAQSGWVEEALDTKQLTTPWGLIYYFPTIHRSSSGYVNAETIISNYPVQALATAEIIPIAIVYLWHRIRERELEEKIVLVNTVHDSAPCEVHPDATEQFVELSKQCFTTDVYNYLEKVYGIEFDVPLGIGLKMGSHWGTGKEIAYNIYRDGREIRVK